MPSKPLPTPERLRELFDYDCDTGLLTWRLLSAKRIKAGDFAGSAHGDGYLSVQADGVQLYAHRVIWAWCFGEWPREEIDHLDTDKCNGRLGNLRDVPRRTNCENRRRAGLNSTTGLLGVTWHKRQKKFVARIRVNGSLIHLGSFDDARIAHEAYIAAKRRLHEGSTL